MSRVPSSIKVKTAPTWEGDGEGSIGLYPSLSGIHQERRRREETVLIAHQVSSTASVELGQPCAPASKLYPDLGTNSGAPGGDKKNDPDDNKKSVESDGKKGDKKDVVCENDDEEEEGGCSSLTKKQIFIFAVLGFLQVFMSCLPGVITPFFAIEVSTQILLVLLSADLPF